MALPPPPPSSGPTVTGLEKYMLDMQRSIFDFYARVDQSKIDKEVFTVAMQIWWDDGLEGLNKRLQAKYKRVIPGEDILADFDNEGNDYTFIPLPELNSHAGRTHLLVKTMLKTNSADYFTQDKTGKTLNKSQAISFNDWKAAMIAGGASPHEIANPPPGLIDFTKFGGEVPSTQNNNHNGFDSSAPPPPTSPARSSNVFVPKPAGTGRASTKPSPQGGRPKPISKGKKKKRNGRPPPKVSSGENKKKASQNRRKRPDEDSSDSSSSSSSDSSRD